MAAGSESPGARTVTYSLVRLGMQCYCCTLLHMFSLSERAGIPGPCFRASVLIQPRVKKNRPTTYLFSSALPFAAAEVSAQCHLGQGRRRSQGLAYTQPFAWGDVHTGLTALPSLSRAHVGRLATATLNHQMQADGSRTDTESTINVLRKYSSEPPQQSPNGDYALGPWSRQPRSV